MGGLIPRPCRSPGCKNTTTTRNGYCIDHKSLAINWHKRKVPKRTYGRKWMKIREVVLSRDKYVCQTCQRTGRLTPANIVDHIVPTMDGGSDDPSNLEAICKNCHDKKTAKERTRAIRGEVKRPQQKPESALDRLCRRLNP